MNREQIKTFSNKFRDSVKTGSSATDNRVIVRANYDFDLGDGIELGEVNEIAKIFVNDVQVASISFAEGDPTSKTVEVDVTANIVAGDYNTFGFQTAIFKNLLGWEVSSEADFTLRVKGKKLFKQEYETKVEIRSINDTWALVI